MTCDLRRITDGDTLTVDEQNLLLAGNARLRAAIEQHRYDMVYAPDERDAASQLSSNEIDERLWAAIEDS